MRERENTAVLRALRDTAADLAARCAPGQGKQALEQLAENLRFSDPVSAPLLQEAEAALTACIQELEQALTEGDLESVPALCEAAEAALTQRNRLCKTYKL